MDPSVPTARYFVDETDAPMVYTVEGESDSILLRSRHSFSAVPGTLHVAEVNPVSERATAFSSEEEGVTITVGLVLLGLWCLAQVCADCLVTQSSCFCPACCDSCLLRLCALRARAPPRPTEPPPITRQPLSLRDRTMSYLLDPRRSEEIRSLEAYYDSHLPRSVIVEMRALRDSHQP